jgi:hypothetical protein
MLQADVLPNMTFSETRKRLIRSHNCVPLINQSASITTSTNEDFASRESGEADSSKASIEAAQYLFEEEL